MNLACNNSKDDVAYKIVLQQLSSKGKTLEDMNKYMMKNQRIKSVIEKNIEHKRQQVLSKFERDYKRGGSKDFVNKVFKCMTSHH
jgi:hypothetical protein